MNIQDTKGEIVRSCSFTSFLFHFFKLQKLTFRRGVSWRSMFSWKYKEEERIGSGSRSNTCIPGNIERCFRHLKQNDNEHA